MQMQIQFSRGNLHKQQNGLYAFVLSADTKREPENYNQQNIGEIECDMSMTFLVRHKERW